MLQENRSIVNPVAVRGCTVKALGVSASVLDLSHVRLVLESNPEWEALPQGESLKVELFLGTQRFSLSGAIQAKGEGWLRMNLDKLLPSSRAHLRSFLSPKRVGESIVEDWSTDQIRHFHGLNESELWFEPNGAVLFTYLDSVDTESQFIIRMPHRGGLIAGKILRKDYIELRSIDDELPFVSLDDKEVYVKLGECRDIVTNFRPTVHLEYNLKQRLLRVISDYLYSTSRKVEMAHMSSVRTLSLSSRGTTNQV